MAMTRRQVKTLIASAFLAATAAVAALCLSIAGAMLHRPPMPTAAARPPAPPAALDRQAPPIDRYAAIWQRNLRQPLFDAPAAAAPQAPQPKLEIELLGTAVDPAFTYGLFRTKDNQVRSVCVGQKIEDAEVLSIADNEATLLFRGRQITLSVRRKEDK